jgi:hypothetical protein
MAAVKIDRPPYAHNWVRYNYPDVLRTTKALVNFDECVPQITYAAGMPIIRDCIALKLDKATAIKAASTKGHKKSQPYVTEFVKAFLKYDEIRNYSGLPSYDQYVAPFQISRDIRIPVKPLVVISENGVLIPIFVVGWASMPLTLFQRRLLMTLLEDAVFSLTDFQNSPGEFISFPYLKGTNSGERSPLVWKRGEYSLLNNEQMKEQVGVYLEALAKAKIIIAGKKKEQPEEKPADNAEVSNPLQTELDV